MAPPRTRDLVARLAPWLVPAAIILGWQAAASGGLVSTRLMPAPSGVAAASRTGKLWANLWVSFLRAASGFLIYAGLGKLADALTRLLERTCLAWSPAYRNI